MTSSYYSDLFAKYPRAFGSVPGQMAKPKSVFEQTREAVPGMAGLTDKAVGVTSDYLGGRVPGDVSSAIQDAGAAWGVASGTPGSGLQDRNMLRMLGLTSLDMQDKGLKDYHQLFSEIAGTQLDPGLSAEIDSRNLNMAAAPDPAQAGQLQSLLAAGQFDEAIAFQREQANLQADLERQRIQAITQAGGRQGPQSGGARSGGFSVAPPSSATSAFPWVFGRGGFGGTGVSPIASAGYSTSRGGGGLSFAGSNPGGMWGSSPFSDTGSAIYSGGDEDWAGIMNNSGWGSYNPYE